MIPTFVKYLSLYTILYNTQQKYDTYLDSQSKEFILNVGTNYDG